MLSHLFRIIGAAIPLILFVLSVALLWKKTTLLHYYVLGAFLSTLLNLFLKGIFQHPRPSEDPKLFRLAVQQGRRFVFKDGIPHDIFGMPSGHAQSALFSTAFIHFALRRPGVTALYAAASLWTMSQRVAYNHHTLGQVAAGALVGAVFGYSMYFMARRKIGGKWTEKKDDWGPI
jgi:membrane-associated phospholipid phosphatase